MISIYRPFAKFVCISLFVVMGLTISLATTVSQSMASSAKYAQAAAQSSLSKQHVSPYVSQLWDDLPKLTPGKKQFSPQFLNTVLAQHSGK